MRLSTDPNDPGYSAFIYNKGSIKVLLEGVELKGVITADEEKRFIVQAVFDDNGKYKLNKDKTEVLKQTIYGNVAILCQ
jgi:hypothetical protein